MNSNEDKEDNENMQQEYNNQITKILKLRRNLESKESIQKKL
jgi:hypothetical protein